MCNLVSNCQNQNAVTVVHKAVGKMPERRVSACRECASRIGSELGKPILEQPNHEFGAYRVEGA